MYKGSSTYHINSCETIEMFYNIRTDLDKLKYAIHINKIVQDVTQENQNCYKILQLLLNTLYVISQTQKNLDFVLSVFKLRLLCILGFTPRIKKCTNCQEENNLYYFSLKDNGFKCEECSRQDKSAIQMNESTKNAIIYTVVCPPKKLYSFDIKDQSLEEFKLIVKLYFNEKLEKLYTERVPTPQTDYQDWLQAIKTLVERADAHFGEKGTVGLGLPGFVNLTTGLAEVTNIRVADNKPILADLERVLDREVRAENDANCFALSEACDEENTQYPSVLGLILGTGFGGGFVINGKIHSGQVGMAGELGHLQLNYHALKLLGWDKAPIYQCGCGNQACLDTYISGRGFEMLYRDLKGEELSAKEIIDRFYAKEESAVDFVRIFVELAAISIGNIITAFDPHMIVLGGGLSNFDYLYEALPKALPAHLMRSAKVPPIKKAKHGDSGGVRGAAALFLNCE